MDSISSILISEVRLDASDLFLGLSRSTPLPTVVVLELIGIPSMTMSGSVLLDIVPTPLILKYALVPASPLVFFISKPGTLPRNAVIIFVSPDRSTDSVFTDSINTPSFFFSSIPPIPVTTTVSNPRTSRLRIKSNSKTSCPSNLSVSTEGLYPIYVACISLGWPAIFSNGTENE